MMFDFCVMHGGKRNEAEIQRPCLRPARAQALKGATATGCQLCNNEHIEMAPPAQPKKETIPLIP